MNSEELIIFNWLEKLSFEKQILGGIKENDVWKKIIKLNSLYEDAIKAERMRCDVLIEHYKKAYMANKIDMDR